jgi:hypothetical protein
VYAVDLFADALVRADGVRYRVCDLEEFEQARHRELIWPGEMDGAGRGLAELDPPAASRARRVPLAQVPLLSTEGRAAWLRRDSRWRPSA